VESFLKEIARQIYEKHPQPELLTIVFPNRRAALYFRKHLGEIISKPVFAPNLITIEEFIGGFSTLKVPDKLELVHRLHATYREVMGDIPSSKNESFDQFYFWGDMLLRDFDELDKYLVNASGLFKDLRNLKEIESGFDYLSEEQRAFLFEFWKSFGENITENKRKFIEVWAKLFNLYDTYRKQLESEGLAYDGMLHRMVAESISPEVTRSYNPAHLVFAGFNALTKAEEIILSFFADSGSTFYWDGDEYYVNNVQQEAGVFFREYQQQASLKKTFPDSFASHLRQDKCVNLYGSAQPSGQVKLMSQVLNKEFEKGLKAEETLIVLPDEKLLMPVLYAIPEPAEKLNVTMGYSLSNTPFFGLVELLVDLQISKRKGHFNHRPVMTLLGHPYVVAAGPAEANAKRKEILQHNWVHIPQNFLATTIPLHRLLFGDNEEGLLPHLVAIIREIGSLEAISDVDKEFAFQFIKILNRIQDVLGGPSDAMGTEKERVQSLKSFLRLFRQLVRAQRIPFSGEPLKGLQIMGVLETRNLDFKNIFILSLNEGVFPSFGSKGSYIPFNVRRAYGLPTITHQDAMYAYLFYRSLQRAENVFLFYNTETDVLGQGEMSRYLQQLIYESGLKINRHVLHNPVQPTALQPIVIRKNDEVMNAIQNLNVGKAGFRGISPSAINVYLECKLKFYFKQIAGIREPKEVDEDVDARILGNFLHKVMERFYRDLSVKKKSKLVEQGDFEGSETTINKLIDEMFIENFRLNPNEKVDYEGQRLIVREIVKRFATRILQQDKARAPFVMEAVEAQGLLYNVKIDHAPGYVVIGGMIDRIDRKDNELRIIDYKTGRDKLEFDSLDSLFVRDVSRNKAAFQTFLYALLHKANHPTHGMTVLPGLINRDYLFGKQSDFGFTLKKGEVVQATDQMMNEFELHLRKILEEIFNPEEVFDQVLQIETCSYCPYKNICYR
jgi:CRISPR/Cas system-associated exonuclease Cas4 (RecB family)